MRLLFTLKDKPTSFSPTNNVTQGRVEGWKQTKQTSHTFSIFRRHRWRSGAQFRRGLYAKHNRTRFCFRLYSDFLVCTHGFSVFFSIKCIDYSLYGIMLNLQQIRRILQRTRARFQRRSRVHNDVT